ncbi:MAG TPA: mechanosensitive ion channel family protein [Pseudonocardiaceae bacterium]|nr:mechanosensitive ion channel family protein [Pseudonocardiaceae bacterium]
MQDGIPVGAGDPSRTAQPPCVAEDGSLCQKMYELTDIDWLARYADTVVDGALSILTIMLLAFGLRLLVHRGISRLTSRVSEDRAPSWLRGRDRDAQVGDGPRPQSAERRAQRARTIGSLLRSISTFAIYGVAFIMVLDVFGVDVAPILASAGVLGIAIGFGAQNLVRDFLSGMFMMLEDQYGVGDTVDLGEAIGDVEAVGLRITTIRDISGTVWYVRNGEILRVGNFSKGFAVAVVDVPLGHQADIDRAGELALQAAREVTEGEHAADVIAPPDLLGVQVVTPYAVTLRLTVKTRPGHQWRVQRALNTRVQSALTTAGVPAPAIAALPTPR